jgi:hypothetical protein
MRSVGNTSIRRTLQAVDENFEALRGREETPRSMLPELNGMREHRFA